MEDEEAAIGRIGRRVGIGELVGFLTSPMVFVRIIGPELGDWEGSGKFSFGRYPFSIFSGFHFLWVCGTALSAWLGPTKPSVS